MDRIKRILSLVEGKDVLDIGSFGQTSAYNLWQEYSKVSLKSLTGIDLPSAISESEEVMNHEVENRDDNIVFGNMENYKFDRKFDVIVAGDVIEHVSNQGLFLDNIRDHLSSDGIFIFTTPNAKWPTVFLKPNPTHTLWHDTFTLKRLLEMHQLKVREMTFYNGNKKRYVFPKNLLTLRQALFVICERS